MLPTLLQSDQIIKSSTSVIINYGAIGAILVLALVSLWFMARYFVSQWKSQQEIYIADKNQMREDVEELRKEMADYIKGDRDKMFKTLSEMITAFNDLSREVRNNK